MSNPFFFLRNKSKCKNNAKKMDEPIFLNLDFQALLQREMKNVQAIEKLDVQISNSKVFVSNIHLSIARKKECLDILHQIKLLLASLQNPKVYFIGDFFDCSFDKSLLIKLFFIYISPTEILKRELL